MAQTTKATQVRPRFRSLTVALVAVALGVSAVPAVAADNNREGAADATAKAVAAKYSGLLRNGRSVETQCSGSRSPFSCNWWIIKGRYDRRSTAAALPIVMRSGEGSKHTKIKYVYTSGQARAAWACLRTDRRGRCAEQGFQVSVN